MKLRRLVTSRSRPDGCVFGPCVSVLCTLAFGLLLCGVGRPVFYVSYLVIQPVPFPDKLTYLSGYVWEATPGLCCFVWNINIDALEEAVYNFEMFTRHFAFGH